MPAVDDWRRRPRRPQSMALATLVRDTRIRLGLTQHELGTRAGVQGSFVSKIETGRVRQPSLHILRPLATALELPLAHLVTVAAPEDEGDPISEVSLPADVRDFAAWLAGLSLPERRRIYVVCRALHVPLLPVPGDLPSEAMEQAA